MYRILLIIDQRSVRNTIKEILEYEGHTLNVTASLAAGIQAIEEHTFDMIILSLSEVDLLELSARIPRHKIAPIIVVAETNSVYLYDDYKGGIVSQIVERPYTPSKILNAVKHLMPNTSTQTAIQDIDTPAPQPKTRRRRSQRVAIGQNILARNSEIVGTSEAMVKLKNHIERVASTDARVLITGANGTGKELVAKQLHLKSKRHNKPFIELNCAAIPIDLIESEMFGHEKGSFTSACAQRKGKFELASGGTLFMDEIGDMSLSAQAKVLRALQEKRITRVGGDFDIEVNTRVIAATNKCLPQEITEGKFREDLYHRLGVIILHVPSLCERKEDIPLLFDHFMGIVCHENGVNTKTVSDSAIEMLINHPWTGNVRELRNVVERLVIFSEKDEICVEDINQYVLADFY